MVWLSGYVVMLLLMSVAALIAVPVTVLGVSLVVKVFSRKPYHKKAVKKNGFRICII
ncbi:hypothetical protein [Desulforhopalus singaporensis]|uniref:Uncharacterized protein n=1 Tax=Desulforhopalus singaporensis TaxID=91360 RepID=A0A1H0J0Z2_9BACT|nr:hypothetical protein [Desulforhopalus singaporensis]SDO37150.1 hypothetical protein SAMN05660330_00099 [Desulforhopalus singaporensis]